MKLLFPIFSLLLFTACNLTPTTYKTEIAQLEDSLFKAFPSVNRVSIEVKNDFGSELIITLGDAELYHATENKRTEITNRAKDIALHIFGADKKPNKGEVVFVQEENTIDVAEDTKKIYDMPIK